MEPLGPKSGAVRLATPEAAAEAQAAPSARTNRPQFDPLLSCLEYIARHFGQPFSRAGAVVGLPLVEGRLTVELLGRAATRMGMTVKVVKRRAAKAPAMVVPFIVLLKNGDAAVVTAKEGRRKLTVVFPASSPIGREVESKWLDERASGYLVYVTADSRPAQEEAEAAAAKLERHWLWSAVWRYWPSWLQIVIAALLINLLALAVPLFTMNVYDRVIPNFALPTLWALAAGVVLALLFDFLLRQMRAIVLDQTGRRVDMRVVSDLFEHALAITMANRTLPAGQIASQLREFETVRDFFTSSSILAVTDFLFIGVFVLVMWMLVGELALVPIVAVPIVLAVTLLIQFPLARSVERTQNESSRRHAILVESLVGIESLKASAGEGVMQRKWEDAVAATARANSSARFWSSLALHFTAFVQQAVGVLIIVWGVFLVSDGTITVGALIATTMLSGRVLAPLSNIAMTITRAQQAFSAMRAISALMALPSERRSQPSAAGAGTREPSVEFRNLSFGYKGATVPALADVSFRIAPGERVGVIGRVGSGKTTLGKLAAGFYEPDQGSILVGGLDTRAYDPADLRTLVGYVPQDPELFLGTVRDNIALGRPQATDEEIAEAARIAGVDVFTASHPLGLNLPIGERGRGLSGGQRQAVALARMIVRQPVVLIMDEPSSALDTASEAQLVRSLERWAGRERTLIVATHRGSFLNMVNRLILIEGGHVLADGPKEQVLSRLKQTAGERVRRKAAQNDA